MSPRALSSKPARSILFGDDRGGCLKGHLRANLRRSCPLMKKRDPWPPCPRTIRVGLIYPYYSGALSTIAGHCLSLPDYTEGGQFSFPKFTRTIRGVLSVLFRQDLPLFSGLYGRGGKCNHSYPGRTSNAHPLSSASIGNVQYNTVITLG